MNLLQKLFPGFFDQKNTPQSSQLSVRTGQTKTREQHLDWAKKRAYAYLDKGNIKAGWDSFVSDLGKHPETDGHMAIGLGCLFMTTGNMSSVEQVRKFIADFN